MTLIKAVVFDLDGTLFKFVLDYVGMRNAVRETIIAAGVPASLLGKDERIRDHVNRMFECAKAGHWSDARVSRIMKEVNAVMDRYEWNSAQKNSPAEGALEVLRSLRKMRLKTGLLTNNSRRSVKYLLRKYGFEKMFDTVLTRDDLVDFNNLKPSPVGLSRVLAKLRVSADETMYVGDSVVDVRAAVSVGAIPVFVTTGFSKEEEVMELHVPVLVIDGLRRLLGCIDEIQKGP